MAKDEAHAERAKAYTAATSALRSAHADEFRALLAAEYAARGLEVKVRKSPDEIAAEKAALEAEKEAKRVAKAAAKVAKAEAALAALKAEVGYEDLAAAIESVTTADQVA